VNRNVGFIGLGREELPMAVDLIETGFAITGFSLGDMSQFIDSWKDIHISTSDR
jgi:hypothetical protein